MRSPRTSWMPAAPWRRPRTCSDTRASPPRRFTLIRIRPGCGPRSTRCPARATRPGRRGDRAAGRDRGGRRRGRRRCSGQVLAGRALLDGRPPGWPRGSSRRSWPRPAGIRCTRVLTIAPAHRLLGRSDLPGSGLPDRPARPARASAWTADAGWSRLAWARKTPGCCLRRRGAAGSAPATGPARWPAARGRGRSRPAALP